MCPWYLVSYALLVSTFLYSLWYVGRVSVAALIANRDEILLLSWLMVCLTCMLGTDRFIMIARKSLVPCCVTGSHILESFVPISQFEGGRDAPQAWLAFPAEEIAFFSVQGLVLIALFAAPLVSQLISCVVTSVMYVGWVALVLVISSCLTTGAH